MSDRDVPRIVTGCRFHLLELVPMFFRTHGPLCAFYWQDDQIAACKARADQLKRELSPHLRLHNDALSHQIDKGGPIAKPEPPPVSRALESAIWVEAHVQAARTSLLHAVGATRPSSHLRADLHGAMASCNEALDRARKTIERERRGRRAA